jgi:hypothetical protein
LVGVLSKRGGEVGIGAQDLIGTFEPALRGTEEDGYSVHYNALWGPAIEAFHTLNDLTTRHEKRIQQLEEQNQQLRNQLNNE